MGNITYMHFNRTISIKEYKDLSCITSSSASENSRKYGSTFWIQRLDEKQNDIQSKDNLVEDSSESEYEANILATEIYPEITDVYENLRDFEIITYEATTCLNSTLQNL